MTEKPKILFISHTTYDKRPLGVDIRDVIQTKVSYQCTSLVQVLSRSMLGRIVAKVEERLMGFFATRAS